LIVARSRWLMALRRHVICLDRKVSERVEESHPQSTWTATGKLVCLVHYQCGQDFLVHVLFVERCSLEHTDTIHDPTLVN
jgi:hypothetical protein